jgi:hypothetical protein
MSPVNPGEVMQLTCTVTNIATELLNSMQPALHITCTRKKKTVHVLCSIPQKKKDGSIFVYILGRKTTARETLSGPRITHTVDNPITN